MLFKKQADGFAPIGFYTPRAKRDFVGLVPKSIAPTVDWPRRAWFVERLKKVQESHAQVYDHGDDVCPVCGDQVPSEIYTLGFFKWPGMYLHFLAHHGVKPTHPFVNAINRAISGQPKDWKTKVAARYQEKFEPSEAKTAYLALTMPGAGSLDMNATLSDQSGIYSINRAGQFFWWFGIDEPKHINATTLMLLHAVINRCNELTVVSLSERFYAASAGVYRTHHLRLVYEPPGARSKLQLSVNYNLELVQKAGSNVS